MPAGLGFMVQAILGMMGSQSLLHVRALSVRLSKGFLVLMAVCSVRSSCVLYLEVVNMVVLSQAILCPVVREWWAGADWFVAVVMHELTWNLSGMVEGACVLTFPAT